MSEIQKLVVGETTETLIRVVFDQRIAQESNEDLLNKVDRALKIRNLKTQVLGFIKRNPNAIFELTVPEYKSEKSLKLRFANFSSHDLDEDTTEFSKYSIVLKDNFVEGEIIQQVTVGKDIVLKIKAK
jgi:hypothetical protein